MKIFERIMLVLGYAFVVFALLLFGLTILDYNPKEKIGLGINNNQSNKLELGKELSITSYNIGYAGLDKDQDFFADGGKNSRAESRDKVMENLRGIWKNIEDIGPDFLLLQEVDINSSRSYKINQLEYFYRQLIDYGYVYGSNYRVAWVPVPIFKPMGKVESGIVSFSKYDATSAHRYDLPGKEKWPVQLFELDRCFTETSYQIEGGPELILINLHLSAFDEGGWIRQQQLNYLKNHLLDEYKKGNHIVVGGDWNHNLPGSDPYEFDHEEEWPFWLKNLPEDFLVDGFHWGVDTKTPTVRTLARKYNKGFNFLAVIDGFLVSDNIEVVDVLTKDDGFTNSDHNPVTMTLILK